jgi:hypothetical protein
MVVGWFFGFVTTTLSRGSTNHHLKTLTTQGTLPLKARPGKKVLTQAYGSNNPLNLVLACKRCNAHKKHNFPSVEQLGRILSIRLESG